MPPHSINPAQWGPCVWRALRWFAEGYPDAPTAQDKQQYTAFFQSLAHVLPCAKCQEHYTAHWTAHPIQLDSRESLLKWLHLIYKESVRKPDFTYEQFLVKTADDSGGSRDWLDWFTLSTYLVVILFVCVVGFSVLKKYKNIE